MQAKQLSLDPRYSVPQDARPRSLFIRRKRKALVTLLFFILATPKKDQQQEEREEKQEKEHRQLELPDLPFP